MRTLIITVLAAALAAPAAAAVGEAASASGAAAWAQATLGPAPVFQQVFRPEEGGTVVRDQTTTVSTALNARTVKCSAADYSGPMLKVLVPGLADLTILNHRNTREGAPCVAAGRCGALGPQDVLKAGEGVESIPVRVVLRKLTAVDGEVCHVTLVETVTTTIRGLAFFHERRQEVADRAAADCR